MKQLAKLKKSVTSMRKDAKGVAFAMSAVMIYMDHNIKEEVLDKLFDALWKLNEVADLIDRLPEEDVQPEQSTHARPDECYLSFTKREAEPWLSFLQNHHYEIGEIMDAMVADSNNFNPDDFHWMLERLALTRRTIDEILDAAKYQLNLPHHHFFNGDVENKKKHENGQKS